MPNIYDMLPSTFLKQANFNEPTLLTIQAVKSENVAPEGKPEEMKPVMYFNERSEGLVLNMTNAGAVAEICGPDTDTWVSQKIVVYVDPNVSFGGKRVGGLRLRAPKTRGQAAMEAQAPAPSFDEMDDDIPF